MKKPHYFYKVAEASEVGKLLQAFVDRCNEVSEVARQWVERQGGDTYYESADGMAGGVAAVIFKNTIAKDGWDKEVAPDGQAYFFPMEGTVLEKEMYDLPVVSETELIGILVLEPIKAKSGFPLPFSFGNQTPLLFLHHAHWYVDVPYCSGSHDCEQITEKEFYRRRMAATNERA